MIVWRQFKVWTHPASDSRMCRLITRALASHPDFFSSIQIFFSGAFSVCGLKVLNPTALTYNQSEFKGQFQYDGPMWFEKNMPWIRKKSVRAEDQINRWWLIDRVELGGSLGQTHFTWLGKWVGPWTSQWRHLTSYLFIFFQSQQLSYYSLWQLNSGSGSLPAYK